MEVENTHRSPMIAIRLVDDTAIYASHFRISGNGIFVGQLKYINEDNTPAYVEDSMLLNMDSVMTYAILHIGGEENEASKN